MLWKYPQLKVVILDCGGEGPQYYCLSRNHNRYEQISLASISATPKQHFPQDQGTLLYFVLNPFLLFVYNNHQLNHFSRDASSRCERNLSE
jgi:hypothetical protein